ncbi:hypothetical protein V2J09_001464 [Rumex salicifolius]
MMKVPSRSRGFDSVQKGFISRKLTFLLCVGCFCVGMLFTNKMWTIPNDTSMPRRSATEDGRQNQITKDCVCFIAFLLSCTLFLKKDVKTEQKDVLKEVSKAHHAIHSLDKTISSLEMELAAAKAAQESVTSKSSELDNYGANSSTRKRKYLMVVGINTAFSSRKRRDSVRETWMPQGEKSKKLEEKGIIMRFVIGHSATAGGILDRSIEAEDKKHGDFLRLEHVEGYLELSAKTKIYFATAVDLWDADFYVKVDDDVHVNIATLGSTLARYRSSPRVYIGCMKSGPVLAQKGVKYHEPEHWKFGEEGNKYFRHATGQLYAISKDLATYISINQHLLHKYVNEDVSLGSWFIGLDVDHVDDRRLCCGTPPDCEWKAQAGNVCVASFDWSCSGVCKSVERMSEVHRRCGEGDNMLWNTRLNCENGSQGKERHRKNVEIPEVLVFHGVNTVTIFIENLTLFRKRKQSVDYWIGSEQGDEFRVYELNFIDFLAYEEREHAISNGLRLFCSGKPLSFYESRRLDVRSP